MTQTHKETAEQIAATKHGFPEGVESSLLRGILHAVLALTEEHRPEPGHPSPGYGYGAHPLGHWDVEHDAFVRHMRKEAVTPIPAVPADGPYVDPYEMDDAPASVGVLPDVPYGAFVTPLVDSASGPGGPVTPAEATRNLPPGYVPDIPRMDAQGVVLTDTGYRYADHEAGRQEGLAQARDAAAAEVAAILASPPLGTAVERLARWVKANAHDH